MPYLNVDPNYPDHPKTRRLIALLGPMADALPIRLWAYCARMHPKDGRLRGYSEAEIEAAIKWTGTPSEAVRGLVSCRFLHRSKSAFQCVDWHQHEGHLEAFSRRGKLAAEARWARHAANNAKGMLEQCSSNAPAVPYRTTPTEGCGAAGAASPPPPPEGEDRAAPDAYKAETPIQKLVCAYKIAKGVAVDDRGWDKANYPRAAKAAGNILKAFEKDLKGAAEWLIGFGERMDKASKTWTLETAARHAWDEKGQRGDGNGQ